MIGIMGGTFNPIHYGHLLMCEFIREEFNLDRILFIPAQNPPHKGTKSIAGAQERLDMVRLAIKSNPFFEASEIEMNRSGASYTIETLRELGESYGDEGRLNLIIGADSLMQINTWKSYEEIVETADIIVARRPDTKNRLLELMAARLKTECNARIFLSDAVALDYSSTDIRRRIQNGLSIKYMVPEDVEAYIGEHELYREK